MPRKARIGRPPRPDRPEPLTIPLARAVKRWLRAQAKREGRGMGAIIEDALALYGRRQGGRHGTR